MKHEEVGEKEKQNESKRKERATKEGLTKVDTKIETKGIDKIKKNSPEAKKTTQMKNGKAHDKKERVKREDIGARNTRNNEKDEKKTNSNKRLKKMRSKIRKKRKKTKHQKGMKK